MQPRFDPSSANVAGATYTEVSGVQALNDHTLYAFAGPPDAVNPVGGVIADASGNLYGTTQVGGSSSACSLLSDAIGCGAVFKLTRSGSKYTESVLYSFQSGNDGANPWAPPTAGASGVLYGTTQYGGGPTTCSPTGAIGCGTVFELTASGETVLYAFKGGKDGANPLGSVTIDQKGAIYGTTFVGGDLSCADGSGGGCGTVYKLTPKGGGYSKSTLYSFKGGTDGEFPYAFLIADAKGALYSTTRSGGVTSCSAESGGCGTVFKLTPSGHRYVETILYDFHGGDGAWPKAGLFADSSGALYGTTMTGGDSSCALSTRHGCGVAYKLTPSGGKYAERVLYKFKGSSSSSGDGAWSRSTLVPGKNGVFYGTTDAGGDASCHGPSGGPGCGIVFQLTPNGKKYSERVLHRFLGGKDGSGPFYGVTLRHGLLYGATVNGGERGCSGYNSPGCGTVFSLKP